MEEGDNPYETLDPSQSMTTHMMAGAAAGIMEHTVMYPIDCVKTRMQCLVPDPQADYRNSIDAFRKIFNNEGPMRTFRGFSAMAIGAGPAHALFFATYEQMKLLIAPNGEYNMIANSCAACTATLLHDAIMVPADVVKQRMQVFGSPYTSPLNCVRETFRKEGFVAFYRSYTTNIWMNIVFQFFTIQTYELVKEKLNPEHKYDPSSHIIAGGVAGAVSATATMPLDVCKTLLNTQQHCTRTQVNYVSGMVAAFRTVKQYSGYSGFIKGLVPRVFYQIPATGISWGVYESFKYFIHKQRNQPDDRYHTSLPSQPKLPDSPLNPIMFPSPISARPNDR